MLFILCKVNGYVSNYEENQPSDYANGERVDWIQLLVDWGLCSVGGSLFYQRNKGSLAEHKNLSGASVYDNYSQ